MTDHYDIVPHCAVTVCLTGDGAAPGLYWCRQGTSRIGVPIRRAGDFLVWGGAGRYSSACAKLVGPLPQPPCLFLCGS
jgi:hypothetical protein